MPIKDYPLQALLSLRENLQRGREQALAEAITEEQAAGAALLSAELAREKAGRALSAAKTTLAGGGHRMRAVDLQRASAHLDGLRRELAAAEANVAARRARHQALGEATSAAREALAAAIRDTAVVSRDFARWTRLRRQEAQRLAEQELEELAARLARGE